MGDFWVFGYGSLMWRPGFDYLEAHRARLSGYRRSLCIRSHVYRGTPERPGLVLGLERGGSCLGMAFRVCGSRAEEVMAYLRAREMMNRVYHEKRLPVRLDGGPTVEAGRYLADGVYLGARRAADGSTRATVQIEVLPNVQVEADVGGEGEGRVGLSWGIDY